LMGVAATLCVLAELARREHPHPVLGIFTRAEETGFVGCMGLCKSGLIPRGAALVGLECSPRRASARVGRGPVVRVGDRLSVFSPWITHHLHASAESLAAQSPAFVYQRALMDGGSCESTAYNLLGFEAGALCLALGNYHNCGADGRIAPEYVAWNDFEGLIALMLEATLSFEVGAAEPKMRARLQRIWEREYKRLHTSARDLRGSPRARERS
jgi:putative aminopeptidase FrvX